MKLTAFVVSKSRESKILARKSDSPLPAQLTSVPSGYDAPHSSRFYFGQTLEGDSGSDENVNSSSDSEIFNTGATCEGVESTLFAGIGVPTAGDIRSLIADLGISESLLEAVDFEEDVLPKLNVERTDWDNAYNFSENFLGEFGSILFDKSAQTEVDQALRNKYPDLVQWLADIQNRQAASPKDKALQLVCLWQDWCAAHCFIKAEKMQHCKGGDFDLQNFNWRTHSKELIRQINRKRHHESSSPSEPVDSELKKMKEQFRILERENRTLKFELDNSANFHNLKNKQREKAIQIAEAGIETLKKLVSVLKQHPKEFDSGSESGSSQNSSDESN